MKKGILLLTLLLSLVSCVQAADWQYLGHTSDKNIFYIDRASLSQNQYTGFQEFWVKVLWKDNYKIKGQPVWFTLEKFGAHCGANQIQEDIQGTDYGITGKVLRTHSPYSRTDGVTPESIGEALYKHICTVTAVRNKPSDTSYTERQQYLNKYTPSGLLGLRSH